MSLSSTKSEIKKIVDTTEEYQVNINGVQTRLIALIEGIGSINKSIVNDEDIDAKGLIENVKTSSGNIAKIAKSALSASANALKTLSADATKQIKKLVDVYNSSLEEDSEEPRLSYTTISLSSVSGCASYLDSDSSDDSRGHFGGGGSSFNDFEYYLGLLSRRDVYSTNIGNWSYVMNDYLQKNNLTGIVESIIIEGRVITCRLKNGHEYKIKNTYNSKDFLVALYKAIQRETNTNSGQING